MSIKEFGTVKITEKKSRDYASEIYETAGLNFPLVISKNENGELIGVRYETEWQEGSTKPIKNKKGMVVDYEPSYENKSLTKDQIKKIDDYIQQNIAV